AKFEYKGNKADLIERLMIASDLTQQRPNNLSKGSESLEREMFENTYSTEKINQENKLRCKSPSFSILSKLFSNDESYNKRQKRVKREAKDLTEFEILLKEIKLLRKDMNIITE
ncbi:9257_t:CDS:1, partial [Racocetra persica]